MDKQERRDAIVRGTEKVLAEYRAWSATFEIYLEGLAEGLWQPVDWLDAMRAWVEKGVAPGAVTATAATSSQLVCPYPATLDADRCISVEIEMAPPPPPPNR